jgi:hypothetical protein
MPVVTDKEFYMDGFLQSSLDFCIEREEKKWDNLLIIDGDEGAGKTTLSWGIGYYWAWKLGKPFNIDNIFFDIEALMKKVTTSKREILIWDEAAIEGLSTQSRNFIQTQLVKVLMTARSRGHYLIFIVPKIFRLNKYISEDRCFFFINVFSKDNISRGTFGLFNKKKKDNLLDAYRFTHKKRYDWANFYGRFTKQYCALIDDHDYNLKKDKAVRDLFRDKNAGDTKVRNELRELRARIFDMPDKLMMSKTRFCEVLGISKSAFYEWKRDSEGKETRLTKRY